MAPTSLVSQRDTSDRDLFLAPFSENKDDKERSIESADSLIEWFSDEYGDQVGVIGAYGASVFDISSMDQSKRDQNPRMKTVESAWNSF